jgi:hypothetical protein
MSEFLLRLPAAVLAFLVIVIATIGAWLLPPHLQNPVLGNFAVLAALAPPFLLPWSLFAGRAGRWFLVAWTSAATVIVTARVGYLLIWLYPRYEFGNYLLVTTPLVLLAVPLWLATWAALSRDAAAARRV